jgi:hypothetical protein
MRGTFHAVALALLCSFVLFVGGCKTAGSRAAFTGEYEVVPLAEAPALLQLHAERVRAAPGLFVYQSGGETYLLLLAGRIEAPGVQMEVIDFKPPVDRTAQARIIVRLHPGLGEEEYPHLVLRLRDAAGISFRARLATLGDQVIELHSIAVADQ